MGLSPRQENTLRLVRRALAVPFADPVLLRGSYIRRSRARELERLLSEAMRAGARAPVSGEGVLPAEDDPAPTNAARACHAPQPRKRRPAVNVAEQDVRPGYAIRADGPSPDPNPERPARETAPIKRPHAPRRATIEPDELEELALEPVRRPVDVARYVAAMRAKAPPAAPAPGPLKPALSREECTRCGIPGFKGCDHQAPFEAEEHRVPTYRELRRARAGC